MENLRWGAGSRGGLLVEQPIELTSAFPTSPFSVAETEPALDTDPRALILASPVARFAFSLEPPWCPKATGKTWFSEGRVHLSLPRWLDHCWFCRHSLLPSVAVLASLLHPVCRGRHTAFLFVTVLVSTLIYTKRNPGPRLTRRRPSWTLWPNDYVITTCIVRSFFFLNFVFSVPAAGVCFWFWFFNSWVAPLKRKINTHFQFLV